MAACEVGATGSVRTKDRVLRATVLAITNEHARCKLEDGRTVWVPIANIEFDAPAAAPPAAPVPAAPSAVSPAAPTAAPTPTPRSPPASPPAAIVEASTNENDSPVGVWPVVGVYAGMLLAAWVTSSFRQALLAGALSAPFFLWRTIAPTRAKRWLVHVVIAALASQALFWGPVLILKQRRSSRIAESPLPISVPPIVETPAKTFAAAECELRTPEDWTRVEPAPWMVRWALLVTNPQGSVTVGLLREPVESLAGSQNLTVYAIDARQWWDGEFVPKGRAPRTWDTVTVSSASAMFEVVEGFKGLEPLAYRFYSFRTPTHFYRVMAFGTPNLVVGKQPVVDQIVASLRCGQGRQVNF